MLLTVVTATYNSEKTIKDTIESVLNQNYPNIEYVIIDGDSKDFTLDIIKSYENKFKAKGISYKWISEKDSGIYDALNKGIEISSGEWISFLGSDDYYLKDSLELYGKEIVKRPDYDFIYSKVQIFQGNKDLKLVDREWSWKVFKRRMDIAHVGAFHNRNYFKKYGKFSTSYKIAGDYELMLRAQSLLKAFQINTITAKMNYGGISNQNVLKSLNETFRAKNETGNISFFICVWDYIYIYVIIMLKKMIYKFS
jgi:glycosyltransferase involved in cell wall biosynthesis